MRVALAPRYRFWMFVLFPTTLGFGTALLWLRSLRWPLDVDETGLTFRHHQRVKWNSVKKICVVRSYIDGHASNMRIDTESGTKKIPVNRLQDGEAVVRAILSSYQRTLRSRSRTEPTVNRSHDPFPVIGRHPVDQTLVGDPATIKGSSEEDPQTSGLGTLKTEKRGLFKATRTPSQFLGGLQRPTLPPPTAISTTVLSAKLANALLLGLLVFGGVLTLAWTAALLWLAVSGLSLLV